MKPLNFEHRIVLVANLISGRASAIFCSDLDAARGLRAAAELGVEVTSNGKANPVLVLVCPEDLVDMREAVPPPDLRATHRQTIEKIDRLLEANIRIGRPVLSARAPS